MNLTHLLLFKYKFNINSDFLFNFSPPIPFRFRKQLYLDEIINVWTRNSYGYTNISVGYEDAQGCSGGC